MGFNSLIIQTKLLSTIHLIQANDIIIIMKNKFSLIISVLIITTISCDTSETINDVVDSKITAKEKLDEVMNSARTDFSADAMLAAIYGREVSEEGKIDLLNTDSFNAFVYTMQSDALQRNEFYVPVFGAGPVKSPINFDTMLSFIKNPTAKNIMGTLFGTLATIAIDPAADYNDSPEILDTLFKRIDVTVFRTVNPTSKIDMFLVPSKSIDSTSIVNSADWIVNFYGDSTSLVLWINSSSGEIKNLAEL